MIEETPIETMLRIKRHTKELLDKADEFLKIFERKGSKNG